jgi:hypothetical protein
MGGSGLIAGLADGVGGGLMEAIGTPVRTGLAGAPGLGVGLGVVIEIPRLGPAPVALP